MKKTGDRLSNRRGMILWGFLFVLSFFYLFAFLTSYKRITSEKESIKSNSLKVIVNPQYQRLLNAESYREGEGDIPYSIINPSGEVVYVYNNGFYKQGDSINVQEVLITDAYFKAQHPLVNKIAFPLVTGKNVTGFVLFFVPERLITNESESHQSIHALQPFVYAYIVSILFFAYILWYYRRKVLSPVQRIVKSANHIVEGNYEDQFLTMEGKNVRSNEMNQLVYSFELMRDEIKHRFEREEKLKRSQKELISCISHDLKTPLSTIKVYAEGLKDGLAKTEEKEQEYLSVIVNKTRILTQMIHDLLDHSNAELNELTLYKEEVYARLYFAPLLEEIEAYVREQGISFTYESLEENLLINMDERRITQVIYNLIENAMKYMDKEDGKIHMRLVYEPVKRVLKITVKDNGQGISLDDIPYVFERFYRGDKSRNMKVAGCGLGLSICKYIINQHGGEINCISTMEKGSEFIVTLPVL